MSSCRYCNKDQPVRKCYLLDSWNVQLYINVERQQLIVVPKGSRTYTVSITYCPNCGNKL